MAQEPVLLSKWYEFSKWLLARVDDFPKSQRFILGQRLADGVLEIMELLVEATYSSRKSDTLAKANRKLEVLRWMVRMAHDRKLLTARQFAFSSEQMTECGRMLGGWIKNSKRGRSPDDHENP